MRADRRLENAEDRSLWLDGADLDDVAQECHDIADQDGQAAQDVTEDRMLRLVARAVPNVQRNRMWHQRIKVDDEQR